MKYQKQSVLGPLLGLITVVFLLFCQVAVGVGVPIAIAFALGRIAGVW